MSATDLETLQFTFDTYVRCKGSITATARALNLGRSAVRARLRNARNKLGLDYETPLVGGTISARKTLMKPLPRLGQIARYICTSAQNNTYAHEAFFENLVAYAEHVGAEILVSRYTYNKSSWGKKSVKPGKSPTAEDKAELWYDEIFDPFICDDRVQLADMLVFCGEMNILPTAKRPLSGFETYAGRKSAIFPHAKIALESIPGTPDDGAKFNYTTGTATVRNYVQKRAGLAAEHHHAYGAVIVEVDHEGNWWVRQINATEDGSFYDLDALVRDGAVSRGHTVEAITWGDIHAEVLDTEIASLAFDDGGILDTLRPQYQFMHDILDFRSRNHHEIRDPHQMFKRHVQGTETVEEELERVRDFILERSFRDWCTMVIVDSNHDNALDRWLREADYRHDPPNALFFLECQLEKYRALARGEENFHTVREALRRRGVPLDVLFLGPDDSFVTCPDAAGGIENGMHGHLGPNGTRGTPIGLSRMGRKSNTGHTHSAQILDGMYVAGTMSLLRLDYNKGPSSWSHSLVVTYPNGKRAILTIYAGKWHGASDSAGASPCEYL